MVAARLIVAVPAVLMLCWLSFNASRIGRADSIAAEAGIEINSWSTQPGQETWARIEADLQRAARWAPGSPDVQEMLGVLDARRLDSPESLAESVVYFAGALQRRPTSPDDWANIAAAKYRIGATDALFEGAIVRAAELGPFEPSVQRIVADYGLAVWDEVAPATREAVARLVANGMVRDPKEMLQIADRRGRLGVACAYLDRSPRTEPKWIQLCQSTEGT